MRRVIPLGILNTGGIKPAAGGIFVLILTDADVAAAGSTFTLEAH